uniref:Uncharacterized protein n=1 Tax=viral metagenome TaxID=1070528 RepID=A0A6H1ZH04_9ZZZZ
MNGLLRQKAIDRWVEKQIRYVDIWVEREVDTILDLHNPEKLLGKKFEDWTPYDMQLLAQVYSGDMDTLNNFVAKKSIKQMHALEEDEI